MGLLLHHLIKDSLLPVGDRGEEFVVLHSMENTLVVEGHVELGVPVLHWGQRVAMHEGGSVVVLAVSRVVRAVLMDEVLQRAQLPLIVWLFYFLLNNIGNVRLELICLALLDLPLLRLVGGLAPSIGLFPNFSFKL